MKKLIIFLLFFFLSCTVSATVLQHHAVIARKNAAVCAEAYAPSLTADQGLEVGAGSGGDFAGYVYVPQQNECLCAIDLYIRVETGDQTGKKYYGRVFTIDGNSDVDTIVGTSSNYIDGTNINGNAPAWISALVDGKITFSPCLNLTSGEDYAITMFVDTDGNLDDDTEIDGSNHWEWGYDNESNGETELQGRCRWAWDASIPYVEEFAIDVEDEGLIKIWTK